MSAKELQSLIIHKIVAIEDESTLKEIFRLVNRESEINTIYTLTKGEKTAVAYGLNDIKKGKVYSSQVGENMLRKSKEVEYDFRSIQRIATTYNTSITECTSAFPMARWQG